MDDGALLETWRQEERQPFRGWDFGYVAERVTEGKPSWSYTDMARTALAGASSAVDLGTGGGERLAALHEAFPPRMVATEGYAPNVAVARERLAPLGVTVVAYDADERHAPIPFPDDSFDVVLDRHEAYEAREVARVLAPGGLFLTQHVAFGSYADLQARFGAVAQWPDVTLDAHVAALKNRGLQIEDARSWWGTIEFRDVGALVYYLKAAPWLVPDFSVERFAPTLLELHRALSSGGTLAFRSGRFVIRAHKPAA